MVCFCNDVGLPTCDEAFKTDAIKMALHINAKNRGAELLSRTIKTQGVKTGIVMFGAVVTAEIFGHTVCLYKNFIFLFLFDIY